MTKLIFMAPLFVVLILLSNMFGLVSDTASSTIYNAIFDPTSLSETGLTIKITTIIASLVAVGALVTSLAFRSDILLFIPIVELFLAFLWDFLVLYEIMKTSIAPEIALLIFSPLALLYLIATVNWWRGLET